MLQMKVSDLCLISGILAIVSFCIYVVPHKANGAAVLALIIGYSLFGGSLVAVSGIVVGWFNQKWKAGTYIIMAIVVMIVLVFWI